MNAIIEAKTAAQTPAIPGFDPMLSMIGQAISAGQDPKVISEMMALMERAEARRARQAFDAAVSAAKGEIPPIFKDRTVDFTSQKGRTNYRHESFAGIAKVVDPILNRHGLSYRHRSAQANGKLTVTCILSHAAGYAEETTLEAAEDHSGNKNTIQAIGSAATYLQRYTLKLALGLSTTDRDDDGQAAGNPGKEPITEEQIATVREKIEVTGSDIAAFCRYMGVEALCDLTQDKYARALEMLARKARKPADAGHVQ